jgi:hypothetical protein
MSLALSPIWVFTARRLRLLAKYGVTEAGQLMRLVYGPEAEMVAVKLDGALSEAQRSRRRIALFLRKQWIRRKRVKESQADMGKSAEPLAKSPHAEDEQIITKTKKHKKLKERKNNA